MSVHDCIQDTTARKRDRDVTNHDTSIPISYNANKRVKSTEWNGGDPNTVVKPVEMPTSCNYPVERSTGCNDLTDMLIRFKSTGDHWRFLHTFLNVMTSVSNRKVKKCKNMMRKDNLTPYRIEHGASIQQLSCYAGVFHVRLNHMKDVTNVDELLTLRGTPKMRLLIQEGFHCVSVDLEKSILYDCTKECAQRLNKESLKASGFISNITQIRHIK